MEKEGYMKISNNSIAIIIVFLIAISLFGSLFLVYKANEIVDFTGGSTGTGDVEVSVGTPPCGDDICQPTEDCSICAADCLPSGQICCSAVNLTGECCVDSDCSGSDVCTTNLCVAGPSGGAGPGGGGAGGGIKLISDFVIDRDLIKITLFQGQSFDYFFSITNIGDRDLELTLEMENFGRYIFPDEKVFSLKKGESRVLELNVFLPPDIKPDVYTSRLYIKSKDVTKSIPLLLEVETKKIVFDVRTTILEEYKTVYLGSSKVIANISVFNLDEKLDNAKLLYAIKDFNGKVLVSKVESVSLIKGISFVRTLEVPIGVEVGDYVYYATITSDEHVAVSGDIFSAVLIKIEAPRRISIGNLIWIIVLILVVFFIIIKNSLLSLYYRSYSFGKKRYNFKEVKRKLRFLRFKHKRKTKIVQPRRKEIIGKLKNKLNTLNKSYKSGYISRKAYLDGRSQINNKRGRVKKKQNI